MADNNTNNPSEELMRQRNEQIVNGGKVRGPFVTVKTGTVLVATNMFTGQIIEKSMGLKIIWPWLRDARISSTHSQPLFTPTSSTLTSDNLRVSFDTDYMFKIVDQTKYASRVMANREGTSMNEEAIKTIGRILDQLVKDHIRQQNSDSFRQTTSLSLNNLLGTQLGNGRTVEDDLEENFGIKITKMLIKDITLPKEITEAAAQAKEAEARRAIEIKDAEAQAKITRTTAQAEADKTKMLAEAQAEQIKQMLAAGLTETSMATKLANEALTNGTNPHTIVLAAAQAKGQAAQSNPQFDMAAMLALFNQMMQQNQQNVQSVQTAASTAQQTPTPPPASPEPTVDFASLPDDEYLTAEDSIVLARERGEESRLAPGGRYHISFLTDDQKARYSVAAQKGKAK